MWLRGVDRWTLDAPQSRLLKIGPEAFPLRLWLGPTLPGSAAQAQPWGVGTTATVFLNGAMT